MVKKRYYIISITALLIFGDLVFALPPVDQRMGVYDTLLGDLVESNCRNCHASGVPSTHHNLVAEGTINPYTNAPFGCQDCHPVVDGNVTLVRNCIQCHNNTFNGMNIRRPHHETQAAMARHCNACHGSLVDNYDDGHYIPTSPTTNMTPNTTFKVINQTSGRKWGGCESCHEPNLTANPPIYRNNNTHHRLGNLSGFINNDNTKCSICHDMHNATYGADSIRYCERCHGYNSLHNIQYDIANTSTLSGYGHLGPNDCQGCHASYVAGSLAPGSDLIVPTIDSLSINHIHVGDTIELTIHGQNFVTTVDGINRSSVVGITNRIITNGTTNFTITPTNISASEIVVTVPSLNEGLYAIYALKDGNIESNKKPFVSVPKVTIGSARKVNSTTVLINGLGFGETYDPAFNNWINVTIMNGTTSRSIQIVSWSDTLINVGSPDTKIGDTVTVNGIFDTNSTKVTN